MSRTCSRRGIPGRLSFGATSLPVSDRPAELNPTLIHGPMPMVSTTGSPGTRHSIAIRSCSADADRSFVWATQTPPSALAGAHATRSEQPRAGSGAGVVELLDSGGEQRSAADAGRVGHTVQLLDQPRQLAPRHLEVRLRGGDGRIADGIAAPADRIGAGDADLLAHLTMRPGDAQQLEGSRLGLAGHQMELWRCGRGLMDPPIVSIRTGPSTLRAVVRGHPPEEDAALGARLPTSSVIVEPGP